jgi:hypothetical protein
VATGTAPFTVTSTTQVANLSVATAGSATSATNASALLQNTSTSTTVYPTFTTSSANGNSQAVFNTSISANLSNASITATTFVGALSGAATSATTAGTVTTAAQPNITSVGTLSSLTVSSTITGSVSGSAGTASLTNGTSGGAIQTWDIRTIAPANMSASRMGFGFTAFNNNNGSPYADYFHLRSYSDASGGNDNLVVFNKSTIGMRIYQQSFGSSTAYSSYKDVAWTDGTNASGSWGISVTGSAGTFTSTSQNSQFNSIGVNTGASGTAGEIRATNNITAYYSDDRLKTRLGNIENALEKVCSLTGFYYEANELAQSLGYEVKREVGLSAQDVERILPEIVAPAPIDEKYKTLRYEKMSALLVEAIKEIANEIKDIKKRLGD